MGLKAIKGEGEERRRAPMTDPESIAMELLIDNDIRHHEGNFFLYDDDSQTWEPLIQDDLKRLILNEIPGLYSIPKVTTIIEILRLRSAIEPIVPDRFTIVFRNGLLNFETLIFRPFNKLDFVVNPLQADYNPGATCPRWYQFLEEIFEGDPDKESKILMLQQFVGLCLTKDCTFQKAMLFIGNGSNGKSVVLSLLEYLFGNANISKLELSQLGNPFHIPALQNKYLNIATEINSKDRFSESLFKMIVAGETVFADRKFQEPFQFKPFVRLIFATNGLPYSTDTTYAFYRRWLILKFNRTFKPDQQDRSLPEKLIRELSGIVNWALIGLKSLHEQNRFTEPDSHIETLKYFEQSNNNVALFLDDMVEVDPDSNILLYDIYRAYVNYCDDGNYRPKSKNNFKIEVLQLLPVVRFYTADGQRKLDNIRLKTENQF
jgi:putative DNA primase/helicase